MKNILLTGGSGFVGGHLQKHLSTRYKVFAPTSKELDGSDAQNLESFLKEKQIDLVIHSGNYSDQHPDHCFVNLQMHYNLEKLQDKVEKILYFGSGAEFDKRFPISMVKEEDFGKSIPVNQYGFYKYVANQCARQSKNIYNLRLFGIFGWDEGYLNKFISNLCAKAVLDLPLTVRQECVFDFLYIEDLFPVIDYALEHDLKYHDYNISSGNPVKLTEIAEIVEEISGKNLGITVLNEGMNLEYTADSNRAREEFSWKPKELRSGVEGLYALFQGDKEHLLVEEIRQSK